ncbi:AbiH family protein [Enterococcus hirae]|uniref:AbiH family protein n=1 Tax=Enterococcus hirae TaxID=1354 RepID=UPI0015F2517E|nr:AbiH family protein [Enterococcus hirae]EMF0152727.1 bacteriophage abortive infection AbiH family protein [Enterococcus hirae]EMF0533655.1 bacteriophage abortive infection AbiH family protein [Enterococcus hirae]MBA5279964.1 bacteriophage abortive infection AbiH family protein [Enterococcus hirae]MCO5510975.1 bacteriophage abortive infection AbiH family protein [Enterococcus hirae]
MTKLYIIGNGFDLAHELPTSYEKDLKTILEENDKKLFELVNNLYFVLNPNSQDDYWSEFEKHIGEITDIEQRKFMDFLKEQTDKFYENTELPSVTDFSYDFDDDNYGDTYTETERAISAISDMNPNFVDYQPWENIDKIRPFIDLGFKQMIEKANLDLINKEKLESINFQSSDFFINFNYTNTLETVYDISPDNILHIHGDLERGLILGNTESKIKQFCLETRENIYSLLNNPENPFEHNAEQKIIRDWKEGKIRSKVAAEELAIFRDKWQDPLMHEFYAASNVSSGIKDKIINSISKLGISFIKNIELAKLEDWLKKNNLKETGITEVITLGHSLGIVDKDYFEFINSEIKPEKWYVSKHDEKSPSIENAKIFSFANMITMFIF